MKSEWAPAPPPKAPRRWPRRLLWIGGGFGLTLIVLYFVATSAFFFKRFILPRVGKALQARVTVSDASIHPFRRVTLHNLKVHGNPLEDPILSVGELTARYSLWDILGGQYTLKEIRVISPEIHLIEYPDGTRNIDALLKPPGASPPPAPPAPDGPATVPRVALTSLLLSNANVRYIRQHADGGQDTFDVSSLHVALTNVANGVPAGLNLGLAARMEQRPAPGSTNSRVDVLSLALAGGMKCWLDASLQPEAVAGELTLDVVEAPSAFGDLAGLRGVLRTDVSPVEITGITLDFQQRNEALGRVRISGPLNVMTLEGRARLELLGIDRRVLNLAGAAFGADFGTTTIQATNDVVLSQGAQVVGLTGDVALGRGTVTLEGKTTPALDLALHYDVQWNQPAQSAAINALTLSVRQDEREIVRSQLVQPMKLSLADPGNAVDNSTIELKVTDFNLADWAMFTGGLQGRLRTEVTLRAEQSGKGLHLKVASDLNGLASPAAMPQAKPMDVQLALALRMENFNTVQIEEANLKLANQGRQAAGVKVAGNYEVKTGSAAIELTGESALTELATLAALPELSLTSGDLKWRAAIRQTVPAPAGTDAPAPDQSVSGEMLLSGVSGRWGAVRLDRFETRLDYALGMRDSVARVDKLGVVFNQGGLPVGRMDLAAQYNLGNQSARVDLNVTNLNERVLQLFVPATPEGPQLASILVNLKAVADYQPQGGSAVRTDLQVANLRFATPPGATAPPPLECTLVLDAVIDKNVAQIRQWTGKLQGGGQPGGGFEVQGRYDLGSRSGQVKLLVQDLNETFLAPVANAALAPATLKSVSLGLNLDATYTAGGESRLTGDFALDRLVYLDPSGALPGKEMGLAMKLDAVLDPEQASVRLAGGTVKMGGSPGGSFEGDGSYRMQSGAGKGTLRLSGVNHQLLGPFLDPHLNGKHLVNGSVGLNVSGSYDPNGPSQVNCQINVDELQTRDPKEPQPGKPLSLGLAVVGGLDKKLLDLETLRISLSPTVRAKNELLVFGKLDMTVSNALTGALQLESDSLDLTPYYDLFMAQPKPGATNVPPETADPGPAPPVTGGGANTEPAPVTLPFRNLVVKARIDRLYLREIEVANWKTEIKLDPGRVQLNPFELILNGAPLTMNADMNLGVPGYQYTVNLDAVRLPVDPIVNTLAPEYYGQVKGQLLARLNVEGAGVTGVNLRKNLKGRADVSLTNATLRVTSRRVRALLYPIAIAMAAPSMMSSPISWVGAEVVMGDGKFKVPIAGAYSAMYVAGVRGEVPIADDVMLSPLNQWPVRLFVERDIAKGLRLVPRGTSSDATYVKLPEFVQLEGPIGGPATKINKTALVGGGLRSILGAEEGAGGSDPFELLRGVAPAR